MYLEQKCRIIDFFRLIHKTGVVSRVRGLASVITKVLWLNPDCTSLLGGKGSNHVTLRSPEQVMVNSEWGVRMNSFWSELITGQGFETSAGNI